MFLTLVQISIHLCERKPKKRKDGTSHDDVYDVPLHTNKHSTSWRF